jgi:hypothetical protein
MKSDNKTAASMDGPDLVTELTESLRLSRRELKLVRGEQELTLESLQRIRRQRAAQGKQLRSFSDLLAELLSEQYWGAQRSRRRSLLGRTDEQTLVAEVEASDLFDGGWYLRQHPEVAKERLSPALDYVRTGHAAGHEPGPRFDTARYLREHPDAENTGLPPLVHHLRNGVA